MGVISKKCSVKTSEKSPKMSHDTSENGNLAIYDATEGGRIKILAVWIISFIGNTTFIEIGS